MQSFCLAPQLLLCWSCEASSRQMTLSHSRGGENFPLCRSGLATTAILIC